MQVVAMIHKIRTIAGLTNQLTLSEGMSVKAQHAALLMSIHDQADHQLPLPKNMSMDAYRLGSMGLKGNLSLQVGRATSLSEMLLGQMADTGPNSWTVGHRRWILNPRLTKVGLGFVTQKDWQDSSYGVIFARDRSGTPPDYQAICWPSKGQFPIAFMAEGLPWSVTLNEQVYRKPVPGQVQITVELLGSDQSWTFRPQESPRYPRGKFTSAINLDGYGESNAIIFSPTPDAGYQVGQTYQVTITGLQKRDGSPTQLTYQTQITSTK